MAKIGELVAQIKADISDLKRGLSEAKSHVSGFSSHTKTQLEQSEHSILNLKNAVIGLGGAFGALKLKQMATEWVQLWGAQDMAQRGLKQVMISMGRYSDESYKSMIKQAEAMQKLTGIGDEMTISGQKMLMTFKQIPDDMMPRTTRAMLDLAALMGGDTNRAALQLGKAAMGLTGELRRVGITVDEETYKLKGFGGVLEQIEEQVHGQAEALGQGYGKWKILGAGIGDVKEGLGGLFHMMAERSGILDTTTKFVNDLADALKDLTKETINFKQVAGQPLITIPARDTNMSWQGSTPAAFSNMDFETIQEFRQYIESLKSMGANVTISKNIEDTLKTLEDFLHDLTTTPYQKEVEELNKKFKIMYETFGQVSFVTNAHNLALDKLKEKYQIVNEVIAGGYQSTTSGKLSDFSSSLSGFSSFSPALNFDSTAIDEIAERNKQRMEELTEIMQKKMLDMIKSMSKTLQDSITDGIVNGFDDVDYRALGKNLAKSFVDNMVSKQFGAAIEKMFNKLVGEEGILSNKISEDYLGDTTWGQMGVAGAYGYNQGGGLGGAGLSMLGYAMAGPIGMVIGGLIGGLDAHKDTGPTTYDLQVQAANDAWSRREMEFTQNLTMVVGSAISEGFVEAYQSQNYQTFIDVFKKDLGDSIVGAFTQIMLADTLKPLMGLFEPGWAKIRSLTDPRTAESGLINEQVWASAEPWLRNYTAYSSGLEMWNKYQENPEDNPLPWFQDYFKGQAHAGAADFNLSNMPNSMMWGDLTLGQWRQLYEDFGTTIEDVVAAFPTNEELDPYLKEMEPVFDAVSGALNNVLEALGINTEAITQNTDALIGPVEAFLRDLETGPLAPATSLASMQSAYDELLAKAIANPEAMSDFLSYAGGSYLPFQQKSSMDYTGVVGGVKSQLYDWMGMYGGNGGPTAQDVGQAVSQALAPVLLDIANQPATINIVIDGQIIKTITLDTMKSPEGVQTIQANV